MEETREEVKEWKHREFLSPLLLLLLFLLHFSLSRLFLFLSTLFSLLFLSLAISLGLEERRHGKGKESKNPNLEADKGDKTLGAFYIIHIHPSTR
jgi:hypothetical protein